MVKKWRSCLSLLVSFAFILSMLFSVTLEVKAADIINLRFSPTIRLSFTPNGISNDVNGSVSGSSSVSGSTSSGFINNGSGSITGGYISGSGTVRGQVSSITNGNYTYHVEVPIDVFTSWSLGGTDNTTYQIVTRWAGTSSVSCTKGSLSNFCVKDSDGTLLFTVLEPWTGAVQIKNRTDIRGINADGYLFKKSLFICFDWTYHGQNYTTSVPDFLVTTDFTFSELQVVCQQYNVTGQEALQVNDTQANQKLDDLNTSSEHIEDSVTNPSGGGILGTIKNFFNGFFGWLYDTILGLFVPSSDYFTTWFTNVNTLLSNKLGMLYAPLDLLISTLNAVYSASSDFSGVPFPEIKWGDTVLVSAQNLTFSNLLGEHFEDIQGYVYFGTDVVLLFAFLMLLQRKITLVLRGHESG